MKVKVKKLTPDAILPHRAYANDAGADLFSIENTEIQPNTSAKIKTGMAIALPGKTAGLVWGKSSVETRGLIVTAGLIDEGYRGEIIVCMYNLTDKIQIVEKGQKIAQFVVMPVYYPEFKEEKELSKSKRGIFGFGSTGHKKEAVQTSTPHSHHLEGPEAVLRNTPQDKKSGEAVPAQGKKEETKI
ncbi:MAG: dUTP diphosphatase [Elusimicrobia bacterium CG08_land_8_20_14_0_20_51_18]|nr:MAG: dUTP diphosphatase [Elusimicrobia bacterium CG08_land_8_20_14_0_20_51_18]